MNKLKTTICAACTLVLASAGTISLADSSNFAGPYIGFQGFAAGAAVDGKSRETGSDGSTQVNTTDTVTAGKATFAAGVEAGYALPMGSMFLIDVGASYTSGEAKLQHETDDSLGSGNVTFKVDQFVTFYIAPTMALSDTSSLYVKLGLSEADIGVSGDIGTPSDLRGETWAIGTRTVLDSGIFIRTEAGYTEYNGISTHGKGGASGVKAIPTTTSFAAEPTIAYGKVSLGFRF